MRFPPAIRERPERVTAIERLLSGDEFAGLVRAEAEAATPEQILAVHGRAYFDQIKEASPDRGLLPLDPRQFLGPHSFEAAMFAAGAACAAVDRVVTADAANAFCCIRPPGHHASQARAMGFCLFNNAAIAARHAQQRHGRGARRDH